MINFALFYEELNLISFLYIFYRVDFLTNK